MIQGHGFVQEWGHSAQPKEPDDVVWIPLGVKHWHGAEPGEIMTRVAISESENDNSVAWLETVDDAQYGKVVHHH